MITRKLEAFVPIHHKMTALLIFSKIFQKNFFFLLIFFKSTYIRYLLLLMSVTCAKGNEAVTNQACTIFYFTKNGQLKILPRHCRYFHCSNFKMTFDKNFFEKKLPFFNFFQISTMTQSIAFSQSLAVK